MKTEKRTAFRSVLIVPLLLSLGALLAYVLWQQEKERARLEQRGPQAIAVAGEDRATTTNMVGERELSNTTSVVPESFEGTWKAEPCPKWAAPGFLIHLGS